MSRIVAALHGAVAVAGSTESTPIRSIVGQSFDTITADLWDASNLYPTPFLGQQAPDSCFVEQPCAHGSSFHVESLKSTSEWQESFAHGFGVTLAGGYDGFKASISASFSDTFQQSVVSDRQSFHFHVWNRQKCYEVTPDCLYNRSNLHPDLVAVMQSMPMNATDGATMATWEKQFIERFGTHVSVASQHGAQIESLTSLDSSCQASSTCLKQQACLKFEFLSYADIDLCGNSSACQMHKGCDTMFESNCVVKGGKRGTDSNSLCTANTSKAEISAFLSSGDMTDPSSAFGFTLKSISEIISQMSMTKEASFLQKAVEYHGCKAPTHAWTQSDNGEYQCSCALKCHNEGELDEKSCTCKCRGDQWHGWHGTTCDETYGQCQMGLDSNNEGRARKCAATGKCESATWGASCSETEVCCLSDFHGACCPFGSTCDCGMFSCTCLVPPSGCTKPDTLAHYHNHGLDPAVNCAAWWEDCDHKEGACKKAASCAPGSYGEQFCAGTCCKHSGHNGTSIATDVLVI